MMGDTPNWQNTGGGYAADIPRIKGVQISVSRSSVIPTPRSVMHPTTLKRFPTRQDAGRALARRLTHFMAASDTVVLALPKGGVAVGIEIARILGLPFDVLLVGRITVPGCGDTPLGAITSGGVRMLNCAMIDNLHLTERDIHDAVLRKSLELAEREHIYRGQRPSLEVADRNVILTDDGSSACAILRSAIRLLRRQHAEKVIVAIPATCHNAACDLRMEADELIVLAEPSSSVPAGKWFEHFESPTNDEVRRMLKSAPLDATFTN
jgi:putative phosphoribosyl transferase